MPESSVRSAAIVGGGIAGIAAALALRSAGWAVTVHERATDLAEVGAGITLAPNALSALDALGAGATVRRAALPDHTGTVLDRHGTPLAATPLREFAHGDLVALHRADLLSALAERLPPDRLRLGTTVLRAETDGTVHTAADSVRYDLVVAADGVRSRLRTQLWPGSHARDSGIHAWRWIADPAPETLCGMVVGAHGEIGVIPIDRGRAYAWAATRRPDLGLAQFADWCDPVPALLAAADPERMIRTDLLDVAVPAELARGRVVLIGDAAHGMLPHLGQGAGLALEDAVVLAAHAPDLATYSAERRPRVARLNRLARRMARVAMPGSEAAARFRDSVTRRLPDELATRRLRSAHDWRVG
ncbi:FAD-dependent monooxygenase [Nocardia thailandica]